MGFSEIDKDATIIYKHNFPNTPELGDITTLDPKTVPDHDILVGGFPCQPFSKSGHQKGVNDARGTLFFNIVKIIEEKRPKIVMLENVKNLIGPKHRDDFNRIIDDFYRLGYAISNKPLILSPNFIPKVFGGRSQERERVLLCAYEISKNALNEKTKDQCKDQFNKFLREFAAKISADWNKQNCKLEEHLEPEVSSLYKLSDEEILQIEAWNDFLKLYLKEKGHPLPSHALWLDDFRSQASCKKRSHTFKKMRYKFNDLPKWKQNLLLQNAQFYSQNKQLIEKWKRAHPELMNFKTSRRKFEWQAGELKDTANCLIQLRPSGIRCKVPTYAPALVAITQTSILGAKLDNGTYRRLSPRECARLQAFPEDYSFESQNDKATYKQLGNAVNVNVIYFALREFLDYFYDEISGLHPEYKQVLNNIKNLNENADKITWRGNN